MSVNKINEDSGQTSTGETVDNAIENHRVQCTKPPKCQMPCEVVKLKDKASTSGIDCKAETSRSNFVIPDKNDTIDCHEDKIRLASLLDVYFKRLFPFEEIYRWLNYGRLGEFHLREFAYTLMDGGTFIRNISFHNFCEMVQHCRQYAPIKIDIGARYNTSPGKNRSLTKVWPAERELVFDIDLSDYNDVRTCCIDADICPKCWKFAAVACKILDTSLREDFGWQHILWVFSGRRGIHCWVCDRSARQLSSQQRKQIIQFYKLSTEFGKRIYLGSKELHHHIKRSFVIAMSIFESMCVEEQNILGTNDGVEQFFSLLPRGSCRDNVRQLLDKQSTSISRWTEFFQYWEFQRISRTEEWKIRPHLLKEIVLHYTYPRLDSEVTEGTGHLLKAPFSLHPTTHKLCTPFDPKKVDGFNVRDVPTLHEFVNEIKSGEISLSDVNLKKQRYYESVKLLKDFADRAHGISESKDGEV